MPLKLRNTRLLPVVLAVLLPCGVVQASAPRSSSDPPGRAAADTSRAQPHRFRLYMSAGASWITAPESGREHTGPGATFEGGFEAAPRSGLRVHFGAEYQWLPIRTSVTGLVLQGVDPEGNPVGTSFSGDQSGTGGMLGLHVEPQLIVLPGTWLLVGGGVAHLSTTNPNGFKAGSVYSSINAGGPAVLVTHTAGPDVSGWAGSWTFGLRRELHFLGPRPALELRWSGIETGSKPLHMASVRIGW
jgi:hypothetical protein